MRRKKQTPELYGTKQVAVILGIPEWRVKNFSEGAAYRLPPSVRAGSGRGSRRLYGWEDIFRIGLADCLVRCGFTPETVGRAVREVPESLFTPYQAMRFREMEPLTDEETPLLVNSGGVWSVKMANQVQKEWNSTIMHEGSSRGFFVVNVANVCDAIFSRLNRFWSGTLDEEGE